MTNIISDLQQRLYKYTGRRNECYLCPVCGYKGNFKNKRLYQSREVRVSSKCPGCGSKERHRLMHLMFNEFYPVPGDAGKRLLHIAPEAFLRPFFKNHFAIYHTADLVMKNVDFKQDLQKMTFADCSYDCIVISRVLTCPPNLEACLREIARVLAPGGIAIIGEVYTLAKTTEYGMNSGERSRKMGIDLIDLLQKYFKRVEAIYSDRYAVEYQLHNRIIINGRPEDNFPDLVRIPGVGFKDVLLLCHT